MTLSPQWLDQLRARVTLSTVVGRTVRLQKAGREFRACCPFHEEKTPSFYVNDAKGFYHCFGCEAHGDVIRWMTDQRGLPFMDAVKELAAEAGLELPAPDPRAARQAEQRAGLHEVVAAAQAWFEENLESDEGRRAREYLATRGFSPATLSAFGFGYAPAARTALKGALSQFDESLLIEAGLLIQVDDKPPYDRFRDRLMLPIRDLRGRVIAFGGRLIETQEGAPKYLNSPDTPLFDKGRTLFNLHRAAPAARKAGRLIVVEGYMDVVALANAGIDEAVAPMGTALTETQIELLWRQVECPILCLDGDSAGQRAAMRAAARALPILKPGHTLGVAQMPFGKDPDDLLRPDGKNALEALLGSAEPLTEVLWRGERDAAPLNTPEAKAGLKQRLLGHADTITHPDIKSLYRRELLARYSAFAFPPRGERASPPSYFRNEARRDPVKGLSVGSAATLRLLATPQSREELAKAVLHGFARFPQAIASCAGLIAQLADRYPSLADAVDQLLDGPGLLEEASAGSICGPVGRSETVRFVFLLEDAEPSRACESLAEAASLLVERPALETALAAATARFAVDPEGAFAEQQRLLKRKLEFESRLRHITGQAT